MRRFLCVPKIYVQNDGQENIYNCTLNNFVYLNLCDQVICCFTLLLNTILQVKRIKFWEVCSTFADPEGGGMGMDPLEKSQKYRVS